MSATPTDQGPRALQCTAKSCADFMRVIFLVFSIYSSITASRNQIIVSTASVSDHSSKVRQFMLARLQTNDHSLEAGRQISEQRFDAQMVMFLSFRDLRFVVVDRIAKEDVWISGLPALSENSGPDFSFFTIPVDHLLHKVIRDTYTKRQILNI